MTQGTGGAPKNTMHNMIMREAAACGRMKPRPLLTDAQRKWLGRADSRGLIECRHPGGFFKHNFQRVMDALTAKGYVTPYIHGGYEITDVGRRALEPNP